MLEAAKQNREDVEEVQDRVVFTVLASGRLPGPEKAVSTAFQVLLSPLVLSTLNLQYIGHITSNS